MSTSSKSQFNQVISAATHSKFRGRQLLDHEGLSCLFILLFIDAKLNTTRLHRIPRSLCYHAPTRDWVVRCLLSVLEKANVGSSIIEQPAAGGGPSPSGLKASATPTPVKLRKSMSGKEKEAKAEKEEKRGGGSGGQNSWLNISMDAALGFRANVTRYGGQGGKKSSSSSASISVHPQAAPVVCRHTLEVLISLAKGGGGGNQRSSQGAFQGGRSVHRNGG